MGVNTTGIQTNVNCANPRQISVSPTSANLSTISATSADGCVRQLTLNPNDANQQYGVVNVPNCSVNNNNTLDVAFQPVRPLFSGFRCELAVLIVQIGLLLVLAAKSELFGRRFLPTTDTAF